jgi:MFS family permease
MSTVLRKLIIANLFSNVGRGMVLIGVSWYMVETSGSGNSLGATMLISTFIALIIGPYLGTLIDRSSKKAILVSENIFGFVCLLSFSIMGFTIIEYPMFVISTIYVLSMIISQVHFPTQSAFVQETFNKNEYGKINSILEVQMQMAQVLAGAFAGLLLVSINLKLILLITSITYLIASILIITIPYTVENKRQRKIKTSWHLDFKEGIVYLYSRKKFLAFGISVFVPFITLMLGNYLAPIFVNLDLEASVLVFSTGEFLYAVGAGIAGLSVVILLRKINRFNVLIVNLFTLTSCLILMVLILESWSFIITYFIMGWVVASTRLISQTIFMIIIPKKLMGRVMTTLDLISVVIRVSLLTVFTVYIDIISASFGYIIIASLLLFSSIVVLVTRKSVEREYYKKIKEKVA